MHVSMWVSKNDLQGSGFFLSPTWAPKTELNTMPWWAILPTHGDTFLPVFFVWDLTLIPSCFSFFDMKLISMNLRLICLTSQTEHSLCYLAMSLNIQQPISGDFLALFPFPPHADSALLSCARSLFLRFSLISKNLTPQGHPSSEESRAQLLPLPNPKVMVPRTFPLYFLPETQLESPLALGDRNPSTQW